MDSKTEVGIKRDPFVAGMLSRMPKDICDTFSNTQLLALKMALSGRKWGTHAIDIRRSIGLWRRHYYFVFVAGKEMRSITDRQRKAVRLAEAMFITIFLFFSALLGLLILYLIKSFLGINIISGFSFGAWDWFVDNI
jgi:hypothetical protein